MASSSMDLKDADHNNRPVTPETLPGTASSSSFEEVAAAVADEMEHFAPSSVCQQRKLSAAIVTTPTPAVPYDYVAGRPTVSVEDLSSSASSLVFETPPPMPQRKKLHQRGVSTCEVPKRKLHNDSSGTPSHHHPKVPARQNSTPVDHLLTNLLNDPTAVRVDAWAEPPASSYNVRAPSYLKDRQKEPSEESLFQLLTLDLIQSASGEPIMGGLCSHPDERIQKALRREKETGHQELPEFIFAVNLAVPGPPVYHLVAYFGCDDITALETNETPVGRLAQKFFFGESDKFRDDTFKLIPRIVDGNFVVKKAVGSKPTILGRKLKQHYIRNPRFMELVVDIGSDSIAKNVVGLSMGYAKQLIVDMMFVMEAVDEQTLPERILGGVRLKNLDFKKRDGQRRVQNYAWKKKKISSSKKR
jgi:hypothetical protein